MAETPLRVVIAGGGVAGLEVLLGLRELAGGRVALTLVAPEDEFVYRPLAAGEPFSVGRMRRVSIGDAAAFAGADHVAATVERVEPEHRHVVIPGHHGLDYDALVLAHGADPTPVVEHALTWDDRADAQLLGGLKRDLEEGYSRRVAVLVPPGPGWPLRGYELALLLATEARDAGADPEVTVVTPDPPPLAVLGPEAVEAVSRELEQAGVSVRSAVSAEVQRGTPEIVVLQPSGERLEIDRVVALPALRGRRIAGVDADADGFLAVDDRCRVLGVERVWSAGDATDFPLKSGGFAAEQAGVVARDIAGVAGAEVEGRRFEPAGRGELAGLPSGRFLTAWLAAGDDELFTHIPRASGVPILTYLQRDLAAGWRPEG